MLFHSIFEKLDKRLIFPVLCPYSTNRNVGLSSTSAFVAFQ
ncbi:hypothetical protein [Colwellia sp. 75C3]|nr:hypothetical protein [Colwellia sp. 75C3]